jgi:amino acid permease
VTTAPTSSSLLLLSSSVSSSSSVLGNFQAIVVCGFGIAGLIYGIVALSGYATFGSDCEAYILTNYSPYDPLLILARVALVGAITVTYPLAVVGLRDRVMDCVVVLLCCCVVVLLCCCVAVLLCCCYRQSYVIDNNEVCIL